MSIGPLENFGSYEEIESVEVEDIGSNGSLNSIEITFHSLSDEAILSSLIKEVSSFYLEYSRTNEEVEKTLTNNQDVRSEAASLAALLGNFSLVEHIADKGDRDIDSFKEILPFAKEILQAASLPGQEKTLQIALERFREKVRNDGLEEVKEFIATNRGWKSRTITIHYTPFPDGCERKAQYFLVRP